MVEVIWVGIKVIEVVVSEEFGLVLFLLDQIYFVYSQELLFCYLDFDVKGCEWVIVKDFGVVFFVGIGGKLSDGYCYDVCVLDYDDWSILLELGYVGLNGDILVWNLVLEDVFEFFFMGICVDVDMLKYQLVLIGDEDCLQLEWYQVLLCGEMLQIIGGGIGQFCLIMLLL